MTETEPQTQERQGQRDRGREIETESQRQRHKDKSRKTETDRQRDRGTETERQWGGWGGLTMIIGLISVQLKLELPTGTELGNIYSNSIFTSKQILNGY